MKKLYVVVLLIFAVLPTELETAELKISEAKLRSFVNHVVKCYNISGLSLAMVTKSHTLFTDGFGVKSLEKRQPVDKYTLFNVGSVSKSFTATIAADAVSMGKIEWDQPLSETFKEFKLSDSFRTERATLRDVLAHKMCVPQYWGATTVAENITRQELIKRLEFYTSICDLRTKYTYSNQMVVAGAAAVEIATCQYWEDAIFDKIFKPLGMSKSRIGSRMSDTDWENTAISYTTIQGKSVPNPEKAQSPILDYMGPAAGVYSNAADMAKYLRFHLNSGKDETGRQVVEAKQLLETHRPNYAINNSPYTTDVYPVQSSIDAYGMGWRTGYYRGHRKVEHTGSYSSYTCRNTFLPDAGVGVWVCEASSYHGYKANQMVSWFALDMLLGTTPWLSETTACTFPAPWVKPPTQSPPTTTTHAPSTRYPQPKCGINFTHYIGDYNHRAFGTFQVSIDKDNRLTCRSGQLLSCTLMPADCQNRFHLRIRGILQYRDPSENKWIVKFEDLKKYVGYQSVHVPYFDGSYPPLFQKGDQHKPTDYPAGRGPLSGICKKPKRRETKTTPQHMSSDALSQRSAVLLVILVAFTNWC